MKKQILFLITVFVSVTCVNAQFVTEELSFSGSGDLTMQLGKYRVGSAITILAEVQGGYAEDGGVYHIVGDWNQLPKITYRNESSITSRLKFHGYVDAQFYVYLFATWENTSPNKTNSNTVRLTIKSSGFFDIAAQGDFTNSSELVSLLTIQSNTENIGIGTTTPTNKLEVNGTIRSKEVKVEAAPWPDFVFTEEHELPDLQEVNTFIQQNGHLPEIPTAQEVEENGISLGEMNAKLLQKIEELTLYVIEQQREIEELKKQNARIDELEVIVKSQNKRIEKLENVRQ